MSRAIHLMFIVAGLLLAAQTYPAAQTQPVLAGTVVDALGARLAGATVTLLRGGQKVEEGFADAVTHWRTTEAFDERTRLAAEYAERYALDHHGLDEEFWARMTARYGQAEIVELAPEFDNLAIPVAHNVHPGDPHRPPGGSVS